MSRTRTVEISALNIAMHDPHSPARYVDLLREVFARRATVRLGELHLAMIGTLYAEDREDPLKGLEGEFFRFVNLDPNEPWFNIETRDAATDEDVSAIQIPKHLLPHLRRIPFCFRPQAHELWFVRRDRSEGLGPATAARLLERLITPLVLEQRFPPVEVTPLPEAGALEKMLAVHTLEKLSIELKRPNSDGGENEQARWQKKLERQNAKRLKVELAAVHAESIKPDEETRSLAEAASRNGKVQIEGRDSVGSKVVESTEEHPLVERVLLDPNIETVQALLRRLADGS